MKRQVSLLRWIGVGLIWLSCMTIQATEVSQPFFKIAVKSYNHFFGDLRQIGTIASDSAFVTAAELPLQLFFGADLLECLDKEAPMGFSIQKTEDDYYPLFVLPLDDATILSDFIVAKWPEAHTVEQEDGLIQIKLETMTFFLKTVGEWTYVTFDEAVFQNIPEDGRAFFNGMEGTLSVQVDVRLLPQDIKKSILEGAQMAQQESELSEDVQISGVAQSFQMFLESYWHCSFDIGMNKPAKALELQTKIQVNPDSSVGKWIQKTNDLSPRFSGFARPDWFVGGYTGVLDDEVIQLQKGQMKDLVKLFQDEAWLAFDSPCINDFFQSNKELVAQISEILKPIAECMEQKKDVQIGYGFHFVPKDINAVLAFTMDEPSTAETTFRKLVDLAKEKMGNDFKNEWLLYDAQTLDGIRFHQIKIPLDDILEKLPSEQQEMKKNLESFRSIVGDSYEIVLGLGNDVVYLALGNQPIPLIQQTLKPAEKVYPEYHTVSLYQVLDFYTTSMLAMGDAGTKMVNTMQIMKEILSEKGDNQCVIYSEYTDDGIYSKVILEEGVTRLIGSLRSILTIMAM